MVINDFNKQKIYSFLYDSYNTKKDKYFITIIEKTTITLNKNLKYNSIKPFYLDNFFM